MQPPKDNDDVTIMQPPTKKGTNDGEVGSLAYLSGYADDGEDERDASILSRGKTVTTETEPPMSSREGVDTSMSSWDRRVVERNEVLELKEQKRKAKSDVAEMMENILS